MLKLDPALLAHLNQIGFDQTAFYDLSSRLAAGEDLTAANLIVGRLAAPHEGDVTRLPEPGSTCARALAAIGQKAIDAGQVGAVVLAGGMATRFGGVVKASVEALPGRTFLDLKLADLAGAGNGRVPAFLMASFATQKALQDLVSAKFAAAAEVFTQFASLRLTPAGQLFVEDDGQASLYAPGHGDMPAALRASGILGRFRSSGGKYLFMSNVDNLAATLDPLLIGLHIESTAAVTVEVVAKVAGDRGGIPARVDGHLQICEAFRIPPAFDQDAVRTFNTNTLIFNADVLEPDYDLTWFAVRKDVQGRPAIQFERLVGQLTAWLDSRFVEVSRTGLHSRFLPAKDPDELAARRGDIKAVLGARGVV